MDMYRRNYQKAQMYADRVLLVKKAAYLQNATGADLRLDAAAYVPKIEQWYRLHGFRAAADESKTSEFLGRAVSEWIRATNGSGCSAAFALQRKEGVLSVLYGSGNRQFTGSFQANIPECSLQATEWVGSPYAFNGLLTGTISAKNLADVFASSDLMNGYISCVLVPLAQAEVQQKIEENRELIAYLDSYKSFQRVHGNASRRVEEIPLAKVISAIALLKEENEYIQPRLANGFVRTAVRFGTDTTSAYRKLVSLIQSSLASDQDPPVFFEEPRDFSLPTSCQSWRDCLTVPYLEVVNTSLVSKLYTVTMQDLKSASSFCMPPLNSYDGFYVKSYAVNEQSMEAFPLASPLAGEGIRIGSIMNSRSQALIPFADLQAHAFVAGATKSGKTTTIKRILTELHAAGIPFIVIEAAKKEYISLVGDIAELKVYTPGNDGQKLGFNPLQPEDGVLIENHVTALVRALFAAIGAEQPIPAAYEGLLQQSYQKAGWAYGMMAYHDESRPFPTFKDVLANVDSYIAQHAQYGPEVKQNLTAALTLRTENMHSGALGGLFQEAWGLQAKDLLESPCVIELADFSPQSAAFIMNILLFKLQTYLARMPESKELKRVIVVEEAHNIFQRTLSEDSGQALNNEYFDKMLSEIRSSGTGLILSDQRPGIMSEAAIANTSIKLIHALVDGEDRKTVGIPSNLTEFQLKKLGELKAGECVMAIRGWQGVQHLMVEAVRQTNNFNSACHVCASRFKCRRPGVKRMLDSMDHAIITYHLAKIQASPYRMPLLESNISNMLQDLQVTAADATKICLLGEILDTHGSSSQQEKRIIANSYANYLKRRLTQ